MNKWTNGQMDHAVGTDRPYVHLSICPKKLYNGLGGKKCPKNHTCQGTWYKKWTNGRKMDRRTNGTCEWGQVIAHAPACPNLSNRENLISWLLKYWSAPITAKLKHEHYYFKHPEWKWQKNVFDAHSTMKNWTSYVRVENVLSDNGFYSTASRTTVPNPAARLPLGRWEPADDHRQWWWNGLRTRGRDFVQLSPKLTFKMTTSDRRRNS